MTFRKHLILVGPLLFTIAQIVFPGGSSNVSERLAIMAAAPDAWQIGHILIAPALILLAVGIFRWYQIAALMGRTIAGVGLFLLLFALAADYSIAVIQLITLEISQVLTGSEIEAALEAMAQSGPVTGTAFVPYLGWVVGGICLGIPLLRTTGFQLAAFGMMSSGGLIVAGGVLQSKVLLLIGGVVLTGAFFLFARAGYEQ